MEKQTCKTLLGRSRQATEYMIREITHICRDMKKRAPGSEGEREAAAYMAGVLQKECGFRNVLSEPFSLHPAGFYGYLYISTVLDVLCCAMFFVNPWISIASGVLTLLLFVLEFGLYYEITDIFYPKSQSVNVTAVKRCAGETRQRIFLNGHIDAAWEWPLNYRFSGAVFEAHGITAIAGVVCYIVLSVCKITGAGEWVFIAGLIGLVFVPSWIGLSFLRNPKRVVDGANDNLTGCYMGIAILREMEKAGIVLEHTEIGVILTGSEESGLRGAKAWCRAHKKEYSDVPTFILSIDTIHDPDQLMVNLRDLNGTLKADEKLASLFLKGAQEVHVPCKKGWVPPMGGSTDSAAFNQGGFRSVAITGLSHSLEDYYHTRKDSYDNLCAEGIENCYKATVASLCLIDEGPFPSC